MVVPHRVRASHVAGDLCSPATSCENAARSQQTPPTMPLIPGRNASPTRRHPASYPAVGKSSATTNRKDTLMNSTRVAAAQLLAGLGLAFALTVAPPAFAHTSHVDVTASAKNTTGHTAGLHPNWHPVRHATTTPQPAQTAPAPAAPAQRQSPAAPVQRPAQAQRDPLAPRPRVTGIPATSVPIAPPGPARQPAF